MATGPNVLWTGVFNKPDGMSQELTRQRIIQEERFGRKPAYNTASIKKSCPDPWKSNTSREQRTSIAPHICGYAGHVPRVPRQDQSRMTSEMAASYTDRRPYLAETRLIAPGGGSSAVGTAPTPVPGVRGSTRTGIYDSLKLAEASRR